MNVMTKTVNRPDQEPDTKNSVKRFGLFKDNLAQISSWSWEASAPNKDSEYISANQLRYDLIVVAITGRTIHFYYQKTLLQGRMAK